MPMKKQNDPFSLYVGAILPEAMYTVRELLGRLGWDSEDVSLALSRGLKSYVFGKHVFVLGPDCIEFIKNAQPQGEQA
jgi:hypothetical protein